MNNKVKYTPEDLEDHETIGAVIKDTKDRILMQEHVKYGFWTIPIGKAKPGQTMKDALKEELFEECNITIKDFKEIAQRKYVYNRNGKKVKVFSHIYEIIEYSGTIENKEPHNHTHQEFKELEEIKNLPHLSDSTLLYLETLGHKRPAHI